MLKQDRAVILVEKIEGVKEQFQNWYTQEYGADAINSEEFQV